MYYTVLKTEMCNITLVGDENGLCNLHLGTSNCKQVFEIKNEWKYYPDFFNDTAQQLKAYFKGSLRVFNVKLNPTGTDYQKRVWNELSKIPYGEVYTYKDIAIRMGNPNSSRSVGMANSKNPIPIIVPCHRVIGSNGKLTGYAYGLELKQNLINLEKTSSIII